MNTRIITLTAALVLAITFTACDDKAVKEAEAAKAAAEAAIAESKAKIAASQEAIAKLKAAAPPAVASGKSGVKLLESMGGMKFEYDNQNRIVKIHKAAFGCTGTETLNYSGDNLVKSTCSTAKEHNADYSRRGNVISLENSNGSVYEFTLNKDGYITNISHENGNDTYHYQNGNAVKIINHESIPDGESSEYASEYKYDNKKSPFMNCKTPKWFLQHRFNDYANANNVTAKADKYEYDSDGFPTKRTSNGTTTTFTYISK
jgi:hypothetical protein